MVMVSFTDTHVPSATTPSMLTNGVTDSLGVALGTGLDVAVAGRVGVTGDIGVGSAIVVQGDLVAVT
jgi:hypothetical protein